ncbi:CYTH domain-containing protein [Spongiimicrobium sp. 3-5]|uniref:CYTH domain-containing protein n=1 Tax=Spongiimicrobium sp. 3-5 TaxID=3332596 RepID=UPI0039807E5C
MIEIERKFLINSVAYKEEAFTHENIAQGFLNTHPARTVRVRITGDTAFLTIKGKSNTAGTTRFEWESKIKVEDAQELLKLCEEGILVKTRYKVKVENHIFEVDEFHGANEGLTVAEVELKEEGEAFKKPVWLGTEVTGDIRYYNSQLSKKPYKNWKS